LTQVNLKTVKGIQEVSLESFRFLTKARILLKFVGFNSKEAVEQFRGALVTIPDTQLYPLADDQFYLFQLEGCEVLTQAGERLGYVQEVLSLPVHDILLVKESKAAKKEYLIPFLKRLFPKIEIGAKKLYVVQDESW